MSRYRIPGGHRRKAAPHRDSTSRAVKRHKAARDVRQTERCSFPNPCACVDCSPETSP